MMRRNLGALLPALLVGTGGGVVSPAPLAQDAKPERPQRMGGYFGIPYPNLHHVSRETMNRPCPFPSGINLARAERRARRKARMRLRKRRGWR